MSLIKCKKVYSLIGEDVKDLSKLPLRELRKMDDIIVCEGMVIESEKTLDPNRRFTEFVCLVCGRRFYFETRRYINVLKALNIDFSGRLQS